LGLPAEACLHHVGSRRFLLERAVRNNFLHCGPYADHDENTLLAQGFLDDD
jgi:hypothetical protein